MMNIFEKTFVSAYTHKMRYIEKKIGYRVMFSKIPSVWIDGYMTCDMEHSWAKHGIHAWGVNYFTMGAVIDRVSSRFLNNQKQYQSWLGAYLVKFKDHKEFTLQDHFDLAVADQKNWLEDFGDPNPYCEMPVQNAIELEPIKVGQYQAKLYEFSGGPSHGDVGGKSHNPENKIEMTLMADMFNSSNPYLQLKGESFLPKEIYSEYENVILGGYIAIINLEEDTKIVLYGNGANKYIPLLKEDILLAFKGVRIEKL